MAKKIAGTNKFMSGVIYRLFYEQYGEVVPFYIGESTNPAVRKSQHQRATTNEEERLVYAATAALNERNIEWNLEVIDTYGEEGPEDKEDRHLMDALRAGYAMTNMKKGNANWMAQRVAEAEDMNQRGYTCPKQYRADKKVWDAEEVAKTAAAKHAEWVAAEKPTVRQQPASLTAYEAQWREERDARRVVESEKKAKRSKAQEIADARHNAWMEEQRHLFEFARKTMTVEEALQYAKRIGDAH